MQNSERNSILCPNCRKLINADEPVCPYCGVTRPGSWGKKTLSTLLHLDPDNIIRTIIYTNMVLFVISILLNPLSLDVSANPLTLLAPSDNSLLLLGATGTIPIERFHRWWSLVSANYLHGGILHIFFNMMALRQLGPLVLREYGFSRMIVLYTLSGVIGFWVSYLAGVPFTIGASASICGLIGSILYYGKSRGGIYGEAMFKQVTGWVVGLFLFGIMVPGINNWGHGGGIIGGVVLGLLLGYQEKRRESLLHKYLANLCILLTIVILAWAILSAVYYRFT
ncbi:MAG: rhomboid family intramembrane serine protease [Deltaproteobacteria bacterium]|nr:rhomboid family intramembrane serine protease [Deltaproteobacteria bacterium]